MSSLSKEAVLVHEALVAPWAGDADACASTRN